MEADGFALPVLERASGMEVCIVGSYAFHVRKRAGCKVFRVTSDVADYVINHGIYAASFSTCTCARGKRDKNRVVLCEHVAAAYMAVAVELEAEDVGEPESGDDG